MLDAIDRVALHRAPKATGDSPTSAEPAALQVDVAPTHQRIATRGAA